MSSSESLEWRNSDHLVPQNQQPFAVIPWGESTGGDQPDGFNQWAPPETLTEQADGSKTDKGQSFVGDEQDASDGSMDSDASESAENTDQLSSQDQQAQLEMVSSDEMEREKTKAFEDGRRIGHAEAEQEFSQAKAVFMKLCDEIHEAQKDVTSFFMPLKQLSLAIAEAAVRGELESSPKIIERLVTETMGDIEHQGEMPVLLSLNQEDLSLIEGHLQEEYPKLAVKQDPRLSRGSLRLTFENSVIEDLMENRLAQISTILADEVPTKNDQDSRDGDVAEQDISEELVGQYEQPLAAEEDANSILKPEPEEADNDDLIIDVTDQHTSEDDQ